MSVGLLFLEQQALAAFKAWHPYSQEFHLTYRSNPFIFYTEKNIANAMIGNATTVSIMPPVVIVIGHWSYCFFNQTPYMKTPSRFTQQQSISVFKVLRALADKVRKIGIVFRMIDVVAGDVTFIIVIFKLLFFKIPTAKACSTHLS